MKSTSATYKQIIASKGARHFIPEIDLELANGTTLNLTGVDIWEDSFSIDTASSSTSSFDIGSAIIGQCKFTINNIDGDYDDYDFFNAEATVWIGLEGDTVPSYRMGFYTVDQPQKANGLISLTLLDNMWKFDVPFSEVGVTFTSSTTARSIVRAICNHCGVTLATQNFHGYDFSITEAPEDIDKMNCREVLQYIAMIGCNFCVMDDTGALNIKWYNTDYTSSTTAVFDLNQSATFGTDEIEITGVKFVINDTAHTIGTGRYRLELENPFVNENNVNDVLNSIWDVLEDFTLQTFNITTASDLSVEIGDRCKIKDYKGRYTYSWVTTNSFKLAGHQVQCNAESPNKTLVKRYSKEVKAAVEESRKQSKELISTYDQSVQRLNKLVEQSMGAFSEYEDSPNGGRIYYISNMPITKDEYGECQFAANSIVWRMAGDVFSVSNDGGLTWRNGYDPSTGELVVNVLSAIGVQAEWIRTGTLTVGGATSGTQYPVIEVYDASNNLICTLDRNGITMHKGIIASPDYAETGLAPIYSDTGMKIDVLNKILRSPYFSIDTSGAYFRGTIQITGDIDIGSGSLRIQPTDYYLAVDFYLTFQASEGFQGTSTVTVVKHTFTEVGGQWVEQTDTICTVTLTDDIPETTPSRLDHTVGQNGRDYYAVNVTSTGSVKTTIDDAILAYVGTHGFQGFLEGIFKGYMESTSGILSGWKYGNAIGTNWAGQVSQGLFMKDGYEFSMMNGFARPNGAALKLFDNVINFGTSDGRFRFYQSDSQGGGDDPNSIDIQTGSTEIAIKKYDANYQLTGKVLWDSDIQTSTTDSPPATLPNGHLFLVYEN